MSLNKKKSGDYDFFFLLSCLTVRIAVADMQIPLFAVGKKRTLFLGKSACPQYNNANKWKREKRKRGTGIQLPRNVLLEWRKL